MPREHVTLLDRAKADYFTASTFIKMNVTDAVVDICAYHCQQCIEKVVKYVILLEGKTYTNDHRSEEYLLDLDNVQIKTLVEEVSSKIDTWATYIRYAKTLLSNKKSVEDILITCEALIEIAEKLTPKKDSDSDFSPSRYFT